ncbi:MAG: 5-deoxy-glucuronate isomerase, partial [Clostridia bacterium]|nr:5-deoxy-glucuronate isomerase [Clostridia bacterium]
MYFKKDVTRGYNAYIDADIDDLGMLMDIGLLVLEPGDTYAIEEPEKETAVLLFEGDVTMRWAGKTVEASRPDCFRHEAYCLLCPRRVRIELTAKTHAELFVQQTDNDRDYEPVLYTPETVQVQHAGANGELMGCMRREIKTFFDYENAPFSNMVLGEVLNFPGRWSSYPPHH